MNPDIEAYVNGELSAAESKSFEALMGNDPNLREAVEQQRQLVEALHYAKLRHIARTAASATRQPRKNKLWAALILVAALASLGLMAVLLTKQFFQEMPAPPGDAAPVPTDEVAPLPPGMKQDVAPPLDTAIAKPATPNNVKNNKAVVAPPAIAQVDQPVGDNRLRGEESEESIDPALKELVDGTFEKYPPFLPTNELFVEELRLLQKKEAKAALKKLRAKALKHGDKPTWQYLYALALLLDDKPEAAAKPLYVLVQPGSSLEEESNWLMGLSFILQGKMAAAKQVLRDISKNTENPRQMAAADLLENLE